MSSESDNNGCSLAALWCLAIISALTNIGHGARINKLEKAIEAMQQADKIEKDNADE